MIHTRLLKGNRLLDMTPERPLQKGLDLQRFLKRGSTQVLSCGTFKNTFFSEHLWTTASMTLKYGILIV